MHHIESCQLSWNVIAHCQTDSVLSTLNYLY